MLFLLLVKSSFGQTKIEHNAVYFLFYIHRELHFQILCKRVQCFDVSIFAQIAQAKQMPNPIEIKFSLCVPSSNNKLHIATKKGLHIKYV
jgi:hypothetical protein